MASEPQRIVPDEDAIELFISECREEQVKLDIIKPHFGDGV